MTVDQLIKFLKQYPATTRVARLGEDYTVVPVMSVTSADMRVAHLFTTDIRRKHEQVVLLD